MQLIANLDCRCTLGEGVVYDDQTDCLLWVDIIEKKFYVYALSDEKLSVYDLPYRLGSFGLTNTAGTIIAAFEKGFAYYAWLTGELNWICRVEEHIPYTRLNDGRVDRSGRFWAGSMVESDKKCASPELAQRAEKGTLYGLDSQGIAQPMLGDIQISNSLCWSPDGKILYHTDTPTRTIYAYAYDQIQQRLSDKKVLVETAPNCYPDGSCVDAAGNVWNAQWGGWQVQCFSPSGEVLQTLT
ncbi:MAG: SMP-30/gluconolactonase/LRE family protein, partial [Arenimonas sp.]|nr:SMP-30/gluconolactonase/LRE family protein [Arenimonas sp.]